VTKAGNRELGRAHGSARLGLRFEDYDLPAGTGQNISADQPVGASADDHRVGGHPTAQRAPTTAELSRSAAPSGSAPNSYPLLFAANDCLLDRSCGVTEQCVSLTSPPAGFGAETVLDLLTRGLAGAKTYCCSPPGTARAPWAGLGFRRRPGVGVAGPAVRHGHDRSPGCGTSGHCHPGGGGPEIAVHGLSGYLADLGGTANRGERSMERVRSGYRSDNRRRDPSATGSTKKWSNPKTNQPGRATPGRNQE
jgi:hypothetical protein